MKRKPSRVAAIVAAALLASVFLSTASLADKADLGVVQSGYFTRTQDPSKSAGAAIAEQLCKVPTPDPRTCLNPAHVTGSTPGYPRRDNYIYVARLNGGDDAIGFIEPDLGSIPFGAIITKITLEFQVEDEPDSGTVGFEEATPGLVFCYVANGWAGADAAPIESMPDTICQGGPTVTFKSAVTRSEPDPATEASRSRRLLLFSVDLAPIAALWAEGLAMYGVAVAPAPDSADNFQVGIRPASVAADAMVFKVEYEGGDEDVTLDDLDDDSDFSSESFEGFGDDTSFSDLSESFDSSSDVAPFALGGTAAESAADAGIITTRAARSKATTPWWVWLFLPIAGLVAYTFGSGLVAQPVSAGTEREGPVGKLMRRGN